MKVLEINKEDLIHNINVIKKINKMEDGLKSPQIIAVVKGNAYGLGLVEFSKIVIEQGIDFLAVSTVEEAIELRNNNIMCKILMLSSTAVKEDVELLIENDIILSVGSSEAIMITEKIAKEKNKYVKAHLKIDTGFGRYGFLYMNPLEIVNTLKNTNNIEITGTFSHFSESYCKKSKWTSIQYERFLNVVENLQLNKVDTRNVTYM